jgi:hypothetical protein
MTVQTLVGLCWHNMCLVLIFLPQNKPIMKNPLKLSVLFLVLVSLNSCYVNRTTVGTGPIGKGDSAVRYSHKKQMYLFWGLVAINQSQPKLPVDCGYQLKSSFNFVDALVSTVTGGIFSMRTVKVLVFKDSPCDPKVIKQEHRLEKEEMKRGK